MIISTMALYSVGSYGMATPYLAFNYLGSHGMILSTMALYSVGSYEMATCHESQNLLFKSEQKK